MNYPSVFRVLSALYGGFAALLVLPLIVAIGFDERPQIASLSITLLITSVVAGSVFLLTGKPRRPARPTDGLGVGILWWLAAPIAAAPPFVLGVAETSVISAIHEAASCLTTAGHSVIEIGDGGWPRSLIVYRGILHLLGAWMTVTMAASVFAAINLGGPGIHRTDLFTIPDGSFFSAVPRVASAVAWMLSLLILGTFSALILTGVPGAPALTTAISIATTGSVDPGMAFVALTPLSELVVFIGLVASVLGLGVLLDVRKGRFLKALGDPETLMLGMVLGLISAACIAFGVSFWPAISWAASAVATASPTVAGAELQGDLPISFALVPAMIGGAALSTAGGVTLARVFVLSRRAGLEFSRLGYPQSLVAFMFRGRKQPESTVIGVWVYLVGYIATAFLAILGFAFLNVPFDSSALAAIGALSNSGALVEQAALLFDSPMHALAIICLVVGRLEILALLPALNRSFWRG